MPTGPLLIVDDDPHNLAAMRQVLRDSYRLIFATSGAQALELAVRQHPALILLDIRLPDLDGYTVCRQLKADSRTENIPVIFVSSLQETQDESEGFDVGAVDYIVKPISPAIVRARVRTHLSLVRSSELMRSYREAIFMLGAAGHYNDTDTGVHIWRMAAYSAALARAVGWEDAQCRALELAAPMHDTGKIGIPDAILRKPGPLTPEEWVVMRSHTRIGHKILSRSEAPLFRLAAEIALRHHERWDGTGYPDGLAGEDIPMSARIVAIADVFDALSMRRPYKEPWPLPKVLSTMHASSGTHFDPMLLQRFEEILPQICEIQAEWNAREEAAHAQSVTDFARFEG